MAARTANLLPLQQALHKNNPLIMFRRLVHHQAAAAAEVATRPAPQYPPIVPSLTAKSSSARRRQTLEHVEKVRAASVQDRLKLLTKIQRMKYVVYPQTFARNADAWYQHFTKTACLPGLPQRFHYGQGEEEEVEENITEEGDPQRGSPPPSSSSSLSPSGGDVEALLLEDVRAYVTHALLQEHWHMKKGRAVLQKCQQQSAAPFLRNLVSGLTTMMIKHNPVFLHSSLDISPQVNYYWLRGQRTIPRGHRRGRTETTRFQIDDKPHSQIRITQQLPQFAPLEDSYTADVPEISLPPDRLPLFRRQYDNNIFTGAKLPDPACYGHTQFHLVPDRFHRERMAKRNESDQVEVFLRCNGMASLFAWTAAQATYQGFWNWADVSRPFASQAVVTDGQYFSFFCYQLNTLALSVETDADNPRKNLFWGTPSLRLYQGVEDGAVVGLDDSVLKLLVQFLMNKP